MHEFTSPCQVLALSSKRTCTRLRFVMLPLRFSHPVSGSFIYLLVIHVLGKCCLVVACSQQDMTCRNGYTRLRATRPDPMLERK